MISIWKGMYLGNSIEVHNTWFRGEKLFINGTLQDFDKNGFGRSSLMGIINKSGDKIFVRARLHSYMFSIGCYVFADDKQVEMKKMMN